jgi:hypothetical protein
VKVTVQVLRECIETIRPAWLAAIRREVEAVPEGERARASSFLRARRPSFDAILRDERLCAEAVALAFADAKAGNGRRRK